MWTSNIVNHAQTQVHIAASECLVEMVNLLKATRQLPGGEVAFSREFVQVYEVEKNEHAKSLLKRCIDILENLEKEHKVSSWIHWWYLDYSNTVAGNAEPIAAALDLLEAALSILCGGENM